MAELEEQAKQIENQILEEASYSKGYSKKLGRRRGKESHHPRPVSNRSRGVHCSSRRAMERRRTAPDTPRPSRSSDGSMTCVVQRSRTRPARERMPNSKRGRRTSTACSQEHTPTWSGPEPTTQKRSWPEPGYDGARAGRTRRAPPHRRPADGQRGTRTGCLITIGYCVCLGCRAALLFLFESTALIRSVLHQAEGEESEGNTQTTPVQNGSLRRQHIRRSPMVNSYRPPNIYEYTE